MMIDNEIAWSAEKLASNSIKQMSSKLYYSDVCRNVALLLGRAGFLAGTGVVDIRSCPLVTIR